MEKWRIIAFNTCIVEWRNHLEDWGQVCAYYLCHGLVVDYTRTEDLSACLVVLLDVILEQSEIDTFVVGYFQNMTHIEDFSSSRQEEGRAETTLHLSY